MLMKFGAQSEPRILWIYHSNIKGILVKSGARSAPGFFGGFFIRDINENWWNPAREARRDFLGIFIETSTRSEPEIPRNPQIPVTSTRSEAKILGNPQIPETSTRSEAKIQGNPQIPETSTRSEAKILGNSQIPAIILVHRGTIRSGGGGANSHSEFAMHSLANLFFALRILRLQSEFSNSHCEIRYTLCESGIRIA